MKKKNILKEYPYHLKFDGIQIKAVSMDKEDLAYLAKASANNLKNLLPKDFNFDTSYDILGVAFNAYTPNLGNKNGHMISGEKGIEIAKSFKGKYINIEHERKNVVGCITDYGYSTFPDDQPISEATALELAKEGKVFNVVLSGIIWRAVNPDFADELAEAGDPSSSHYGSISASWEVAFKEFNVAKGSKYFKECEILDGEVMVDSMKEKLKTFGGKGADENGAPLYLNLIGETILSLGIGLTETPAAEVKGVITTDNQTETQESNDDEVSQTFMPASDEEKKCDKNQSENVIEEEASIKLIMKIQDIKDITDESMKEISASAISDFIEQKLAENSEQWKKQLDEKDGLSNTLNEQVTNLQAQLDELKKSKEESETALAQLKEAAALHELEETFQVRMASIDAEYDLTDEDREMIAEDLKAIASEEEFQKWFKKFATFASAKSKAAKKAMAEKMKKDGEMKCAKASETATVEDVIVTKEEVKEEAKAEEVIAEAVSEASVKSDVANAAAPAQESLRDRMAAAFGGDNMKIKVN